MVKTYKSISDLTTLASLSGSSNMLLILSPGTGDILGEVTLDDFKSWALVDVNAALAALDASKPNRTVIALGDVTGSVLIDVTLGRTYTATVTGDVTIALTNIPGDGTEAEVTLELVQDAVGGHTATFPATWKWPGGMALVLSSGAGNEDHVGIRARSDSVSAYPVENVGVVV